MQIPGIGTVVSWHELQDVSLPLVSFKSMVHFDADDETLVSTSTLRFRELDELERTLGEAGFAAQEVRDAPDRPGKEWVVIAKAVS